jgi:ribosomal 30S subunit maturation factor RimM
LGVLAAGIHQGVIGVDQIEAWRGQRVIDPDGEQLGKLDEVFFDAASGMPLLIAVKSGLLGRKSTLVPINDATVGPDYVRVTHRKEVVDQAAGIGGEAAPDAVALGALGGAYGLKFADRVRLESATEREATRAQAQEARAHAGQLEADAQRKLAAHEVAHEQAQTAGDSAGRAERDADEAQQAAVEAREQADRFGSV